MHYIVQANFAVWKENIGQGLVQEFTSQIEHVHEEAENAKGYVWRYIDDPDPKRIERVFGIERIIFNMSVWESIDDLKEFTYKNLHSDVMRKRAQWFDHLAQHTLVLWWVKVGHMPTAEEAKARFDMLERLGPTPEAFTFAKPFSCPF